MPLIVFPQPAPSPSPFIKTLERGQQNVMLSNIGAAQTFTGTTLPTGSVAFGVPASTAVEDGVDNFTIQIDSGGGTPGATITLLGSLDGTTWYSLGDIGAAPGIFFTSKVIAPGVKLRYVSAYARLYTGSGGTTDSITVSAYA